ncbi:MAG: SDR family NAD(P)-dependent oxidoreductase [Rhodospirillales bacterium]|nr:SDR family NAD(P)-dependent oxidoreductase [Rhodospirillales bacterium]
MAPDTAFTAAFQAVAEGVAHRIVADIDWPRFLAAFEARRPRPLFAHLAAEIAGGSARAAPARTGGVDAAAGGAATGGAAMPSRGPRAGEGAAAGAAGGGSAPVGATRPRLDRAGIAALLAALLGHPDPSRIDPERGLFEQGLDSLMAVSLRRRLEEEAGVPVPAAILFAHPTVAALADWLAGQARDVPAAAGPATRHASASHAAPAQAAPADAPIAVIGLGCRFPGADGPDAFAAGLFACGDAIRTVPADRPTAAAWAAAPETVRRAGFLDGVERFDAAFFGISPREAAQLDPQQRLLLTTAWEALEHAGLAPDRLAGSRTGVFVGATGSDYATLALGGTRDAHSLVGQPSNTLAGRLAYQFGLHGPALTVDTACSSSLVALHLAVRALRSGEAEMALAAGVNLLLTPGTSVMLANAGLLSPNARCAVFDAAADGYVRGEGVGVLVLKPLARAEAEGDRVLAVIAGSASNHDGRSSSFTAPNGGAQAAVIRDALADACLSPDQVDAIEAHGTGTQLGDPIELDALAEVFAGHDRPLLVGSVKAAIGHAEAAAGIAGVIKSVLCLQRGTLPPQPHYATRNPHARTDTPVRVAGEGSGPEAHEEAHEEAHRPAHAVRAGLDPGIPTGTALHHVGVSAFGASGTNAHVVLSRAEIPAREQGDGPPRLLLSAATPEALERLRSAVTASRADGLDFADACHTAWVGRARLRHWLLADSPAALATAPPRTGPVPDLPTPRGRRVVLPPTPLDPLPFWLAAAAEPADHGPVLGPPHQSARSGETVWEMRFDPAAAWLRDHRVHDTVVMPGAAFLALALAAAPEGLADVAFLRRLDVPPAGVAVQLVRTRDGAIGLYAELDGAWAEIATARAAAVVAPSPLAGEGWGEEAMPPDADDGTALAADLAARGFEFGPSYRIVGALRRREARAEAVLTRLLPPGPTSGLPLDPMLIDAALQTLTALLPPADTPFLPARIGRVVPARDAGAIALPGGGAPSPHPSPARGEGAGPNPSSVMGEGAGPNPSPASREGAGPRLRARARLGASDLGAAMGDAGLCRDDGTPVLTLEAVTLQPAPATPGAWMHDVVWRPAADPGTGLHGRWHVIGPGSTAFGAASHDETGTAPLPAGIDGILDLRPLQAAPLAEPVEAIAALGRAAAAGEPRPQLVLVSRGASTAPPVLPGPGPAASALMGLQPVIAAEHPALRCRWVDLDPDDPALPRDLAGPAGRYAIRQGRVLTPERVKAPPPPAGPVRLAPGPEHSFADLRLLPDPGRAPGPGEVRIAVTAAGLNFKDALTILGRLPEAPIGLECAGTVVAVGPDVTGFAPGDAVLGFGPGALASCVTLPAARVLHRPAWLDADTAATLPVAWLTARHGLHDLARIRPGMRVLVHAGAGGVGSMAVRVARLAGARVFATASAGKEAAARAAGAEAVGDSRSPGFAEAARAWVGPGGFDIVLNALGPEIAAASAALLAPDGTFLEIGNAPRPEGVGRWIAYDLDQPMAADPGWFADRMRAGLALLREGRLTPPRRSVFPLALAGEALQALAQGRTIGKLVLRFPTAPATDGTWLVTGGTGAVGRAIARALRAAGVPRVVLAARHPAEVPGCETVECDVTVPSAVEVLLRDLSDLRGVVHAAGVVRDGMLDALDTADLAAVLAPKAGAAELLHLLTHDRPLAQFVLVSSSAGTLGGAGQGAYAAANAWLDRLAAARRADGLAAVAIGSGPWAGGAGAAGQAAGGRAAGGRAAGGQDAGGQERGGQDAGGMFARLTAAQQARLAREGMRPMAPARAAAAVMQVLADGVPHRLLMDHAAPQMPAEALAAAPDAHTGAAMRDSLLAAPPAERLPRLQQALAERLVVLPARCATSASTRCSRSACATSWRRASDSTCPPRSPSTIRRSRPSPPTCCPCSPAPNRRWRRWTKRRWPTCSPPNSGRHHERERRSARGAAPRAAGDPQPQGAARRRRTPRAGGGAGCGPGRGGRHRLPLRRRGGRTGVVLARAGRGPRRRRPPSRRPLGRHRRCRPARRRVPRGRGGVRPPLLHHRAARGRGHGPAAPAAAGGDLGGAGPCRLRPGRPRGQPHRRVRGSRHPRLRAPRARCGDRPPLRRRHLARGRLRSHRLSARPARTDPDLGHRLLLLAGRGACRDAGAARRGMRTGAGRRGQPDALARSVRKFRERGHAGPRRSLQELRCAGRRLRAGRGRRDRRAEAAAGRAARRRSCARSAARQRGQPGRAQRRPHRAERPGADRADPRGARRCRPGAGRHRLCRGAWHRHAAGRPDRVACAGRRLRRPGPDGVDRRGQDPVRPYRGGRRDRRADQGGAGGGRGHAAAQPALHPPQPGDQRGIGAAGGAGRRATGDPPRGGQRVRLLRHERPCGARGAAAARCHATPAHCAAGVRPQPLPAAGRDVAGTGNGRGRAGAAARRGRAGAAAGAGGRPALRHRRAGASRRAADAAGRRAGPHQGQLPRAARGRHPAGRAGEACGRAHRAAEPSGLGRGVDHPSRGHRTARGGGLRAPCGGRSRSVRRRRRSRLARPG